MSSFKIFGFQYQRNFFNSWISITNEQISTKLLPKLPDVLFNPKKIIVKDFFVCYDEKSKFLNFWYWHCFDVLTQGCENVDSINMALYCPWIILFKKGTYETLSKTLKDIYIKNLTILITGKVKLRHIVCFTNKQVRLLKNIDRPKKIFRPLAWISGTPRWLAT